MLFCVLIKIEVGFASICMALYFRKDGDCFAEIKRISGIAEIGVYGIYANCQGHRRLAELHSLKSHCNVYFVKKQQQNHNSKMVVTQSCNVLLCLFVRVVVNVVV